MPKTNDSTAERFSDNPIANVTKATPEQAAAAAKRGEAYAAKEERERAIRKRISELESER